MQLVLPDVGGFRELALAESHSSPLAGHFGVRRTLHFLKQRFWWPSMRKHVK